MDRLTSNEISDLMEAYSEVYAPKEEVVEENIEQLDEYAAGGVPGSGGAVRMYSRPVANTGSSYQSRFARPMNAGTPQRTGRATPVSRPPIGGLPSNYRGQELQAGARASASQVGTSRQGSAGTSAAPSAAAPRPATRPAPAPVARPTAAVARPAAAPVRPATTAKTSPVAAPTPTSSTTTAAPLEKKPSLASGLADLRKMRMASQMRQAGANVTSTQLASFDPFDIVKGYLLDEGYADTEESALVIMANMSEEWRQSILDEF